MYVDTPDAPYYSEHIPGAPDGDPEGTERLAKVIELVNGLDHSVFDHELFDKDDFTFSSGQSRGPIRRVAVVHDQHDGRQVDIHVSRDDTRDMRWFEVELWSADGDEQLRVRRAEDVMVQVVAWLTTGKLAPRHFTHGDVLAHMVQDLGHGYTKHEIQMRAGDTAYAPGTSKKFLSGTGYVHYTVHAMGIHVTREPDGLQLVFRKAGQ